MSWFCVRHDGASQLAGQPRGPSEDDIDLNKKKKLLQVGKSKFFGKKALLPGEGRSDCSCAAAGGPALPAASVDSAAGPGTNSVSWQSEKTITNLLKKFSPSGTRAILESPPGGQGGGGGYRVDLHTLLISRVFMSSFKFV